MSLCLKSCKSWLQIRFLSSFLFSCSVPHLICLTRMEGLLKQRTDAEFFSKQIQKAIIRREKCNAIKHISSRILAVKFAFLFILFIHFNFDFVAIRLRSFIVFAFLSIHYYIYIVQSADP